MNKSGHIRPRNVGVLLAVSLFAGALIAPSATAVQELWAGNWNIHQGRTMILHQDGQVVHGHWEGASNGKIQGEVYDAGQSWAGTYKDTGSGDKGKFNVKLTSDQEHFHGWYKSCGYLTCDSRTDWGGKRL